MNATAATILVQLTHAADAQTGANRIRAMLGAKVVLFDADSISFRFAARASNRANHCTIKLDASDTYTVTFHSCRGLNVREISKVEGMFAEDLRAHFERETGLYLSI